jgi:hypothetical protein
MKIIKSGSIITRMYSVFVLLLTTVIISSCGVTKYNFSTSSVVPAAEGSVKVKKDGNGNYNIDLNVLHLAEAKKLSPAKEMYVVWMDTEQNGRKNLGQLKTSSSFLSKTLKSSLNTVKSFKPTGFFITAEDEADIEYPTGAIVLTTGTY